MRKKQNLKEGNVEIYIGRKKIGEKRNERKRM
jgi:hypothetical protein